MHGMVLFLRPSYRLHQTIHFGSKLQDIFVTEIDNKCILIRTQHKRSSSYLLLFAEYFAMQLRLNQQQTPAYNVITKQAIFHNNRQIIFKNGAFCY